MNKMTQKEIVLGLLARGLRLCQIDAGNIYHIGRLAARIEELRRDGHDIRKVMAPRHPGGRKVAFYYLHNWQTLAISMGDPVQLEIAGGQ